MLYETYSVLPRLEDHRELEQLLHLDHLTANKHEPLNMFCRSS